MKVLNVFSNEFMDSRCADYCYEIVSSEIPSLTIPDQSLSVDQILDRYQSGGDYMNARGVRFDVPDHISDEDAEAFMLYQDDPDDLTFYDELSNVASSYVSFKEKDKVFKELEQKRLEEKRLKDLQDEDDAIDRELRIERKKFRRKRQLDLDESLDKV